MDMSKLAVELFADRPRRHGAGQPNPPVNTGRVKQTDGIDPLPEEHNPIMSAPEPVDAAEFRTHGQPTVVAPLDMNSPQDPRATAHTTLAHSSPVGADSSVGEVTLGPAAGLDATARGPAAHATAVHASSDAVLATGGLGFDTAGATAGVDDMLGVGVMGGVSDITHVMEPITSAGDVVTPAGYAPGAVAAAVAQERAGHAAAPAAVAAAMMGGGPVSGRPLASQVQQALEEAQRVGEKLG